MKNLYLLVLLIFGNNTFSMIIDNLDDKRANWSAISDNVMGGISEFNFYEVEEGEEKFYRLEGTVSTANNGGFIQLRASVSFANSEKEGKNLQGVRLNVRGNGETYYIHIRTNESWSPSDYYATTFKADADWKMIDLPFNKFERRWSKDSRLDPKKIRSFGIVAYGRDHISDVSVSTIEFYY